MQFALFNQLQMPKPWRENAEVLMYRETIEEAVYAEAVGFDAYWQTEHHGRSPCQARGLTTHRSGRGNSGALRFGGLVRGRG